jgi:hypothetical protein
MCGDHTVEFSGCDDYAQSWAGIGRRLSDRREAR